jgi:hypothetical protein
MVGQGVTIDLPTTTVRARAFPPTIIAGPRELRVALKQHESEVIVDDRKLVGEFRKYLFLERLSKVILIGWLAQILGNVTLKAIEKNYQVQGTVWHDWKIKKSGGSITFTPGNMSEIP